MRKILALLLLISVTAAGEDSIRSFPIPTIEKLGNELYQRDQMAATAFDALFATHPEAQRLPMKGWVTEWNKEHHRVYFIQELESQYSLAYIATIPDRGAPEIEDKQGAALPEFVAKRFAARRAAIAAIPKFMAERYNFEVLAACRTFLAVFSRSG